MVEGHLDGRVVIVGGGVAGAATALALQQAGVRTVVVERSPGRRWRIGEALPPAANPLLRRLGVWDRFVADGHRESFGNASAWGSGDLVDHSFMFDPHGTGWHLDRVRFDAMLLDAAREHGARVVIGMGEIATLGDGYQVRVVTAGGDETVIDAAFVVDATGRTASLARQIERTRGLRKHLDRLVGVVAILATGDPRGDPDSRTIAEAVEDGWWYSAALPGGRLAVAFMTDGDIAARRAAHTLDGWVALLGATDHTLARLVTHECSMPVRPRALLANSSRLRVATGPAWLAVGDAAIAHDPLSSQGIASALLLGLSAAEARRDRLNGEQDAFIRYREFVHTLYAEYLGDLAYYYRQGSRWPGSPFWVRRTDDRPRIDQPHAATLWPPTSMA